MAFRKEYWARRLRANFRISNADARRDYWAGVADDQSAWTGVHATARTLAYRSPATSEPRPLVSRKASQIPRRIQSQPLTDSKPAAFADQPRPAEPDSFSVAMEWCSKCFGLLKGRILSVQDTRSIDFHLIVMTISAVLFIFGAFLGGVFIMLYALVLDFRRSKKGDL